MFGFMFVTFFLSMWISNTATTAMLIPIVEAIVKELYESDQHTGSRHNVGLVFCGYSIVNKPIGSY